MYRVRKDQKPHASDFNPFWIPCGHAAIFISAFLNFAALFLGYGFLGMAMDKERDGVYLDVCVTIPGQERWEKRTIPPELLQQKNIGLCLLLCIVAFSIYGYVWVHSIMANIKLMNGESPGCAGELLCYLFVPFYSLYWFYSRSGRLSDNARSWGIGIKKWRGVYLLAALFLNTAYVLALMQSHLNGFARQAETGTDRLS